MASSDYDGGIGGKFQKRPFRRGPATPYDRPQSAIRRTNPNPNPNPIGNNNGWISKIVDPASKFFSSVFQKRLTAPPAQPSPEENSLSRHKAPEAVCNMRKPSDEALEQSVSFGENAANDYDIDGTQQNTPSGTDGFFEVEQLLKQKTFTRAEFERLTDLLRSRTVEPSTSKLAVDYENKKAAVFTEQVNHMEKSIIEPSMSCPAVSYERKGKAIVSEEDDGMKSSCLHGDITNLAVNLHIPEEEAVSPAEIAKSYMGSKPSKVSPSTLSVRSRIVREDAAFPTVPCTKKSSVALLASRPSVHFSGILEHSGNGYMTPKPRGRSALYKMSRSPYFKAHPPTNTTVGRPVRDGLAIFSTSSALVSPKYLLSSGKQVQKRRSSELDNDFGSYGPIRRVCQKSNLMSPSSERHSSPPGNLLTSLTTPLDQDVNQRSASSTQKPFASVVPVPPQSIEMARKIFEELGKLVPSPKEKSSERKGSGNLDVASESPLPSLRYSIAPKQDRIKENDPSENSVLAVQAIHEVVAMDNSITSAIDVKSRRTVAEIAVSGSTTIPSQKKPASQMTMAEESLELDANKYNIASASALSATGNDKLLEKPLAFSFKNKPASSSILKGEADVKASDRPATEKGGDVMLSAAPASISQLSPTSTVPSPLADRSVPKKDIFATASKSASGGSLITTVVWEPESMKFGASAIPTAGIIESSGLDKGVKTQKDADLYKSFGNVTSSGLSTSTSSVLFTFGASTGPNQSNVSLSSTSSSPPVSVGSAAAYISKTSITANPSSPSTSAMEPIFASILSSQFGSGTSTGVPISSSASREKFDSGDSDRKSIKTSPFAISSSDAPGMSGAFLNTKMTGSALATSSVFSSIGGSSSAPTMPSVLLNTTNDSPPMSTLSVFSSTTNGIFGFSASSQPSSSSSTFAKNNFSNSGSFCGGTGGSIFGAQQTQSGSGTSSFPQRSAVQCGSFSSGTAFGLNASSSLSSGISQFGSANSVGTVFGSHTGFSSAVAGSSSSACIPSFAPTAATGLFSSNSQPSSSSLSASTLGSNQPLPSTGLSFGPSASTSGNFTSPFGASPAPVFPFSSVSTATSSASPCSTQPVFSRPTQGTGFSSGSPGSDGMHIEDGMADDNIQAAALSVPRVGQQAAISLSTSNLQIGTPAAALSDAVPQNPSPFHTASFELSTGGSFSLGSGGGGDKSGRRFVRVKRDKHRKK